MRNNARGREVISQVLENMRSQTEELRFSRVVSSAYNVHLHPDDFARLEGLIPEIVSQARRALDEELRRMNRARPLEAKIRGWIKQPRIPYERPASTWSINILSDPNQELEPGDILVDATLVTSDSENFDGSRTQRIVTRSQRESSEASSATAQRAAPAGAGTLATVRWRDQQGEHAFRMVTPSIKIGRGGASYWVDVKLDTAPDVSREHLRIRYDEASHGFFVQDLSTFGTTVDGVALPAKPGGEASAQAAPEVPLPSRATIALAGVVSLSFEAEART